jgi:hydroxyacylglutathione hydrolase
VLLRPFLHAPGSCASYLFGCTTHQKLAVVDPNAELVDDYIETAAATGSEIVAVFETHVQADHVSGLPSLVARTGATGTCRSAPAWSSITLRSWTGKWWSSAIRS